MNQFELSRRVQELEERLNKLAPAVLERLDTLELDQEVLWDDLEKRQKKFPWERKASP